MNSDKLILSYVFAHYIVEKCAITDAELYLFSTFSQFITRATGFVPQIVSDSWCWEDLFLSAL